MDWRRSLSWRSRQKQKSVRSALREIVPSDMLPFRSAIAPGLVADLWTVHNLVEGAPRRTAVDDAVRDDILLTVLRMPNVWREP